MPVIPRQAATRHGEERLPPGLVLICRHSSAPLHPCGGVPAGEADHFSGWIPYPQYPQYPPELPFSEFTHYPHNTHNTQNTRREGNALNFGLSTGRRGRIAGRFPPPPESPFIHAVQVPVARAGSSLLLPVPRDVFLYAFTGDCFTTFFLLLFLRFKYPFRRFGLLRFFRRGFVFLPLDAGIPGF